MSIKVTGPIIQHLGFQGEHYHLKVVFPLQVVNEEDPNYHEVEQEQYTVGLRAVILKFRAEDLPAHGVHCEIVHFDAGRAIRDHFGVDDEQEVP